MDKNLFFPIWIIYLMISFRLGNNYKTWLVRQKVKVKLISMNNERIFKFLVPNTRRMHLLTHITSPLNIINLWPVSWIKVNKLNCLIWACYFPSSPYLPAQHTHGDEILEKKALDGNWRRIFADNLLLFRDSGRNKRMISIQFPRNID